MCGRRCCLGDHCSPISDTTILSSTGSGANVMTLTIQLPYALASAATALLGYVVYALTSNGWLGLLTALCFLGLGPGARRCCSPPGGGSSAGGAG
ncbi:Na+/H+ antiporter NhaC family protein [Ornithinimicrobium ciconiae]|uniref:Na+/H+ antiporter NhaC family protein n=1 Tax=Ornithinimicrobium ciconiae TaxID=2594265 RepID=UPI001D181B06|nr:Na+/H+ antiporter NhaC family protein [Ornithinimicrobium ciconiae]